MNKELSNIIDEFWNDYVKHKNDKYVVNPSIPIIWFGDMEAYLASKVKIVTVALNPSNVEFEARTKEEISRCSDDSFLRFKDGAELYRRNELDEHGKKVLFRTLNNYFKDEPYTNWFNCFEKRLRKFNASYYTGTEANTAIHIDIFSSLATSPTWGVLKKEHGSYCEELKNTALFKKLFEYLKPDIAFYSANAEALKDVFGLGKTEILKKYSANSNCAINVYAFNDVLIISGRNWQKPFQGMSDEFIEKAMADIKKQFKNYLRMYDK